MSILLQLAILVLIYVIGHVLFIQHKGSLKKGLDAFLGKTSHSDTHDTHGHH